jgi:phosphate transport system permease protein
VIGRRQSLAARHRRERRFQWYGRAALGIAFAMLAVLMASILVPGVKGFQRTEIAVDVIADAPLRKQAMACPAHAGCPGPTLTLPGAAAMAREGLKQRFPLVQDATERRQLLLMLAPGYERAAYDALPDAAEAGARFTLWLPVADGLHRLHREGGDVQGVTAKQKEWFAYLRDVGQVREAFRADFFTRGDSRAPEKAGMGGSIKGTLFTMIICMGLALPIGVLAAVYLEEFAARGRLRDFIEVNINNLAAVPSIVFGLLGLAVFLGLFGLPRSSALVGGMTLALMVLPVIIIATRAALQAVPPSIRDGARALGASPLQVVAHHVLPLAMPGILTGTILGMARAIGETAPLLMIGMVAFIADIPRGVTDPATAMPVQIFLWAGSPERGFAEKTASAILVLIVILLLLNALAIVLRRKYERRW